MMRQIYLSFVLPNPNKFLSMFPNKRDICNLMYSLSCYEQENIQFLKSLVSRDNMDADVLSLRDVFREVIEFLIDIELSYEKDPRVLKLYKEKFMDLINSRVLSENLGLFYDESSNYCYRRLKERIRVEGE